MLERKAFLANPNHQYRLSQCREHDCSANNKKNGDYYDYLRLPYFIGEYELQEKWWKKKLLSKFALFHR